MINKLKKIDAGDLNISYFEVGTNTGLPVILLHGFPYDIRAYKEVVPLLVSSCRIIIPYLRGYGKTTFLQNIFWKLWRFYKLLEILGHCLSASGSTGVFVNSWKNILKLWGFCRTSRNSRKMFSNFRKFKYLKKYSETLGIL